ncbi:MAG: LLM class F420-dependent oxidoreductase [Actinomycetota bacterium]|nr:LLM class F420-dependent oxidoreductase [Actinomycetota bacterium]
MDEDPSRYGMTVPLAGSLLDHYEIFRELVDLGYTDVWSAEANDTDGLTPLALAAAWAPELRLGTAILPVFTRGPALLAQSAAALASAAPGRFLLGVGSSSDVIVERWNGIPFEDPYQRVRDTVRFLRVALTGEKVTEDYETFQVSGFRLGRVPEQQPPILVAALQEGMLRLAGREGDGAIINWLSAADVGRVSEIVASQGPEKEIVARIFVCPSDDREQVLAGGRFAMAAYLNVPVYRAFHEWMGRGELLDEHWEQWATGDRKGSLAKIPEQVVDDLIVHGTPDDCRAHIQRYVQAGVTCPALAVLPLTGGDMRQAVRDLAPVN